MSADDLDARLDVACQTVREAGALAADLFVHRHRLVIDRKGEQDLVSEADRRCEDLIVSRLSDAFPHDGFLGEEGGKRNLGAEAVWVIDPIDGTHNFLTGIALWCVSVGLVLNGTLVLGVVFDPVADEIFSARKGGGAFLNGQSIQVSREADLKRARVCIGFSYRRSVGAHVRAVESLLTAGCEYLRLGSGALGLAYTAAGRFEGYWERHINSWDAAGGLVLVTEAGGWSNDLLVKDGLQRGNEILAATPSLFGPLKHLTGFGEGGS